MRLRALRSIAFSALLLTASSSAAFAVGDGGGNSMPGSAQRQAVRGDSGGYTLQSDLQFVRGNGGGYTVPTRGDGGGYSVPTGGDGDGYAQPRDNIQPVHGDGGGYSSPVAPVNHEEFERWV
jgi:hypothetical protein